ncbi:hypothetical protein [Brevundimonas sp. FT23028]|uniref:hypothetical protein n=1 Tax=Brevundimonas sp. FT23028 TaxID=3393748 RepID=UPI003B58629B
MTVWRNTEIRTPLLMLLLRLTCVALLAATAWSGPAVAQAPPAAPRIEDHMAWYDATLRETADVPASERTRLIVQRIRNLNPAAPLLPNPDDRWNLLAAQDAIALYEADPALAARHAAVLRDHIGASTERFTALFPRYRAPTAVVIAPSLGFNGQVFSRDNRPIPYFAPDATARLQSEASLRYLVDHELFHAYHLRHFSICGEVWCRLWREGLAVYVGARLNPSLGDRDLSLETPRPIRRVIDANMTLAMCRVKQHFRSFNSADAVGIFDTPQDLDPRLPPRFGYYLGMRMAATLNETIPLDRLATMTPAEVRPLLEAELAKYDCPPASPVALPASG